MDSSIRDVASSYNVNMQVKCVTRDIFESEIFAVKLPCLRVNSVSIAVSYK